MRFLKTRLWNVLFTLSINLENYNLKLGKFTKKYDNDIKFMKTIKIQL